MPRGTTTRPPSVSCAYSARGTVGAAAATVDRRERRAVGHAQRAVADAYLDVRVAGRGESPRSGVGELWYALDRDHLAASSASTAAW